MKLLTYLMLSLFTACQHYKQNELAVVDEVIIDSGQSQFSRSIASDKSKNTLLNTESPCLPSTETETETDRDIPVSKNLKYFGMFSSMGTDAADYQKWQQDILATLQMGNLQAIEFILLDNDPSYIRSLLLFKKKLSFLKKYNVNIIISIQSLFFDKNGLLKKNYAKTWEQMLAIIKVSKAAIIGVYLFDEPFWNVHMNQVNHNEKYVSASTMYDNLNQIGKLVHSTLKKVSLIFIEAYPMVNLSLKIPDTFDWIGMDCYTGFENCEGTSIPAYYQTLKTLKPNKKLIIMPPAIIFKKYSDIQYADRVALKELFLKYMNWITNEPEVILSLSFMYRYDQAIEVFTGANKICESAEVHRLFWKKLQLSMGRAIN